MKIADMHCDTVNRVYYRRQNGEDINMYNNSLSVDFNRMKAGNYLMQFFACFVNMGETDTAADDVLGMIELFHKEIGQHNDIIGHIRCYDDIVCNMSSGKMSALLTIEEGGVLGGSIDMLHHVYQQGVRLITLTWNYENELGYPNRINQITGEALPETERGLKPAGIEIVREMERLGMIVDVSHLGDAGFYDVAANTKKPFVASHSNARVMASHVRNLKDDMIKIIGDRGGVIGINFCPAFLKDEKEENQVSRIEDMVRHIIHIRNVGGTDVCALGSDFDGITGELEISSCDKMDMLVEGMVKAGISYDEADKITSGNVLGCLKEII